MMQEKTDERVVDVALTEELATRYITAEAILQALEGYPEKEARGVLRWADSTGEPSKALLAWSRKRGAVRDRKRRRERAPGRGRRLALEGALRTTHRKLLASEYLVEHRQKALEGRVYYEELQERIEALSRGYHGDTERIETGTLRLRIECSGEYPPEMLERRMEFGPEAERNLERHVSQGAELTRGEALRIEVYKVAGEALVSELRAQVEFLEARLEDALTEYLRDPSGYIRCEVKELPYIPREFGR